MKKILFLIPILLMCMLATAQVPESDSLTTSAREQDIFRKINIKQDQEMIDLVKLHIRRNQQGGLIPGFRVEIFFSSELNARQKASQIKSEFLNTYPGYNVYITYVSPDFKVRVGDFRTKNEALRVMNEINDKFPRAFVVPDQIELPKHF